MTYDLVMITPFINKNYIFEFLNSVKGVKEVKICLVLVDMLNTPISLNDFLVYKSSDLDIVHLKIGKKLSSSKSRNEGLNYIARSNKKYKFLMFPDDDTTFDSSFYKEFKNLESGNYILNLFTEGLKEPYAKYYKADRSLMSQENINYVGCVRFLFSSKLIQELGLFDENMGVGAKYGSGEDGDYFLRALKFSPLIYLKSLYTFHPSPKDTYSKISMNSMLVRFSNYSKGAIFLCFKHKMYFKAVKFIFRALVGFVISILKFDIRIALGYLYAFFIRLRTFIILVLKANC